MEILTTFFASLLDLWIDAAFWLIIGLIISGLLKATLSSDQLGRHFSGTGPLPAIKAAILGIPLPLCSCGVIPAAVGLRRGGASKSATTAFLISTPETGVDSIAISYALLGPFMAIIRPIAATTSAIVAAMLVLVFENEQPKAVTTEPKTSSCASGCCASQTNNTPAKTNWLTRLWQGQRYAFTNLISDLSLWLIIGLIISALVITFVPPEALAEISRGPMAMLLMAVVGVPMYICASASTPLAASFMLAGVSPGAVLVFLLAGPATNMATIGIVQKELGSRTLISYLIGVIGVAIVFGYLTNFLVDSFTINIQAQLASSNEMIPTTLMWLSGVVLALLITWDLVNKYRPKPSAKTSGCNSTVG
jgi:uncharacterized membrane protein YraQ (UPF0718 family)